MRKGIGGIAWVAWIFLMLSMTSQCDNPLGPTYAPAGHLYELTVVGATLYIFVTYLIARAVSRRALVRAMVVETAVLTVAAVIWAVYHARYTGTPMVSDFMGYARVTPYHEQLAVPGFVGLAGGMLVLAIALRHEPPVTSSMLTS